MKIPISICGKTYKLNYFEYLAYQNLVRIESLEKKVNSFLKKLTADAEKGKIMKNKILTNNEVAELNNYKAVLNSLIEAYIFAQSIEEKIPLTESMRIVVKEIAELFQE